MYHYHYYPHLPAPYCAGIILACILFLLTCYHRRPVTYQGKRTVGGLLGTVVGVGLALLKMLVERE